MPSSGDAARPTRVGRYVLFDEIASGGMGSVHFGRIDGIAGFTRCVAIKALHAHLAKDPQFAAMFLDEAKLAARVRHPNVAATLDVIADEGRLLIVMDYVHGVSLSRLVQLATEAGERIPVDVAVSILHGALLGLHAVHEATAEGGEPLDMIHRDFSPQNIVVGADGAARLIDFGVAKAVGRLTTTQEGRIKGKVKYMAPEQLVGGLVTRQVDVYAAGVVLWEMLAGERLFGGSDGVELEGAMARVLDQPVPPPSSKVAGLPPALDDVVMRALAHDRKARFGTARQMASALADVCPPATADVVGEYVERMAHDVLAPRAERMRAIELQPLPAASPPDGALAEASAAEAQVPRRRIRVALPLALAAAALVGVGVFAVWRMGSAPTSAAAAVASSPPVASVASSGPTVAPSAVPPSDGVAASSASLSPSSSSTASSAASSAAAARRPARLAPTRSGKPCKARQVQDADGIIRWVRDC